MAGESLPTIKTVCSECLREVAVSAGEISLHHRPPRTWYSFRCPACCIVAQKDADARAVSLLLGAGVKVQPTVEDPPPLPEPPPRVELTYDDRLDLVLMCRDEFMGRLVEGWAA